MAQKFNSKEELIENLEKLEQRIILLENENHQLRKGIADKKLPKTKLLSPKFLTRSFAIWGHFFTAHLIISIVLIIITYCATFTMLASLIQNIRDDVNIPRYTPAYVLPPTLTPEP